MRRTAAGPIGLTLALAIFAASTTPGSAGIIITNCSAADGDLQVNFAEGLLAGEEAAGWQFFLPSNLDYESGSFDAAKRKAGKVTFKDRTSIQLDGDPSGDQNVEAKLTGKLRGDADAFTIRLRLKDKTGGETFKLKADGACQDEP